MNKLYSVVHTECGEGVLMSSLCNTKFLIWIIELLLTD